MPHTLRAPLLAVAIIPGGARAWYLPGVAPHDYVMGERVELKVNKLTSVRTQVPYSYYSLPFCEPAEGIRMTAENLGEFLTGDRIENSPYVIHMRESSQCQVLCQKVYRKKDAEALKAAIDEAYTQNWIIDNLPAASMHTSTATVHQGFDDDESSKVESYRKGFPVGYNVIQAVVHKSGTTGLTTTTVTSVEHFLYNHVEITVQYHEDPGGGGSRVVGFAVEPKSVKHRFAGGEHWDGSSGPSNEAMPEGYMPELTTCRVTGMGGDPLAAAAQASAREAGAAAREAKHDDDDELYRPEDDAPWQPHPVSGEVEPQRVEPGTVLFTYDVTWERSRVRWASRWDVYLASGSTAKGQAAHWIPLVNSLGVALALGGLVAILLGRAVKGDLDRYNDAEFGPDAERASSAGGWFGGASSRGLLAEGRDQAADKAASSKLRGAELPEEVGWKLVHSRAFATPDWPLAFAVAHGSGQQLLMAALWTGVLAGVGFLSPANRGSLMVAALCLFCAFSFTGAHRGGRLFRAFCATSAASGSWGGADLVPAWPPGVPVWAWPGLGVGLGFPGCCAACLAAANVVLGSMGSSGAVPLSPSLQLAFFWLAAVLPLSLVGGAAGFASEPPITWPLPVAKAARAVPPLPWSATPAVACALGGALPFCAILGELHFALGGLWVDSYYYVFGFALVSLVILATTCAEVACVLVYCQLCAEDPRWWWRAFLCSGSTAGYVFLYSAVYFARLEANLAVTYAIYFGYTALLCAALFLICGSVGFSAALWFVKSIYLAIKSD